ncbi:hypothetical protein ACEQ8H_001260 [Pleosporales sp. CAS-2024a]
MALNLKTALAAPERERDNSSDVTHPSTAHQYNKRTGRPIRKSAGKVKKAAGYVDSSIIEEDYSSSSSESEPEDEPMERRRRTEKAKQKRKRSPSPPSPRLEPLIYNQVVDELTDDETGGAHRRNTPKKQPVTLQFNVPLGYHGPLFVKLDSALLKDNEDDRRHDICKIKTKKPHVDNAPGQADGVTARYPSFTDVPPEIRNAIYRYVFVRSERLAIPQNQHGSGLCQSAQFLRTCKLVHDEACSILYGENEFYFTRHHDTRTPFWEPEPKEIGYQDVLHFLKMIGPENLQCRSTQALTLYPQYLRDIRIDFDDALPKNAVNVNIEGRRFLVDDYLINCLRILRNAKLRKVTMAFYGRRQIFRSDVKFLGYLEQIKADEVINQTVSIYMPTKLSNWVWTDIKEQMTRKKKLYEKK